MPSILVFYHFLHPDPVVSSVHLSELAAGLAERGWQVTGYACNRGSGKLEVSYPPAETWSGVSLRRTWRPDWKQASGRGRILNALWMIGAWSLLAIKRRSSPDVILMGTDPILSVLIAPVWRLLHPHTRIVHWCFDLYPEAAYADGLLRRESLPARLLEWLLVRSYAACNLIVDIGSCMKTLLLQYGPQLKTATLVPWAMSEPVHALPIPAAAREQIFGNARLALMYSGTLGRAHSYDALLALMRELRGDSVHLAFSVKGNREDALRAAVTEADTNISFVPFAAAERLEERLATADVHVVSLREEWTGTVVPSKFFGALAVGRPVLFCGSPESAIARWIIEHGVGWVLKAGAEREVAESMRRLADDPEQAAKLRDHCHEVYTREFSRAIVLDAWNEHLQSLLPATRQQLSLTQAAVSERSRGNAT